LGRTNLENRNKQRLKLKDIGSTAKKTNFMVLKLIAISILNTTVSLYLPPFLFAHLSLSLSSLSANFLLLSKSPISKNWFIISLPNQVLLFYFCDLFYYSHNFF
jgi:hypothetical protein